jgi:hypothetical protein
MQQAGYRDESLFVSFEGAMKYRGLSLALTEA